MRHWQGAWYLSVHDLKRKRLRAFITLGLIGYSLFFLLPMLENLLDGKRSWALSWSVDYIWLTLLPCLGLAVVQSVGFSFKSEVTGKSLAALRTLPIPIAQIATSRILSMLIVVKLSNLLFFSAFYWGLMLQGVTIGIIDYLLFVVCWSFYSLITGILYVYCETILSARGYFWFCLIIVFVFLFAILAHAIATGDSLIVHSFLADRSVKVLLAAASLLLSICFVALGRIAIIKSLKKRDFVY